MFTAEPKQKDVSIGKWARVHGKLICPVCMGEAMHLNSKKSPEFLVTKEFYQGQIHVWVLCESEGHVSRIVIGEHKGEIRIGVVPFESEIGGW